MYVLIIRELDMFCIVNIKIHNVITLNITININIETLKVEHYIEKEIVCLNH